MLLVKNLHNLSWFYRENYTEGAQPVPLLAGEFHRGTLRHRISNREGVSPVAAGAWFKPFDFEA